MIADRAGELRVLTFQAGGLAFALPVISVREVITSNQIQKLANVPAYIAGMLSLRGNVIPVIDLRERLSLDASAVARRILIIQAPAGVVGLLVDDVRAVVKARVDDLQPIPAEMPQLRRELFMGILRIGDALVSLLDPSKVFHPEEEEELATLAARAPAGSAG